MTAQKRREKARNWSPEDAEAAYQNGLKAFKDFEREILSRQHEHTSDQGRANMPNPGWNFGAGTSGCIE
jgi:hypothetical protein